MMAERALKNLHNLMLEGKYDEAVTAGIEAMADVKLTINAIRDMRDRAAK